MFAPTIASQNNTRYEDLLPNLSQSSPPNPKIQTVNMCVNSRRKVVFASQFHNDLRYTQSASNATPQLDIRSTPSGSPDSVPN